MKNKILLSLKRGLNNSKKLIFAASLAISSLLAFQANAQTAQWWDNMGTSAATNGTWDETSPNWANSSTLTASTVVFGDGNFPIFNAGIAGMTNMNITLNSTVDIVGMGDATTSTGGASGAPVTNLFINGSGTLNLPAGLWPFECGNSSPSPTININVPITGTGGIIQHNNGSLSLYGNNTYSGGTQTTGGQIVNYNNNNSFGTGIITNEGGNAIFLCTNGTAHIVTITNAFFVNIPTASIFDWGDGNTILSGPINIYATTQIKNNGGSGTVLTISGPISSVGGAFGVNLETPSSGTMTLSGANTYTGPTAICDAGTATISVTSINSVTTPAQQASSSLGKPSSAANGIITIGNAGFLGTLIYTGPGETSDRQINLGGTTGGATIEMDGTGPLVLTSPIGVGSGDNGAKTLTLQGTSTTANTIMGTISNSTSATSVTKAQSGSWTLAGTNRFSGNLTISAGTLTIGGPGNLNAGSYAGTISDAGTLVFASSIGQTWSGVLSGAGNFNVASTGTLTLSGTASTFTGLFNITGGLLAFTSDASLGAVPGTVKANAITLNGGPASGLRVTANGITVSANRGITLGANGGEIQVASGDTCTYSGVISGSGPFQDGQNASTGLGVLALGGSESYTNSTTIACGTFRLLLSASLGNSSDIIMSNATFFDVSTQSSFGLSTSNSFTAYGGTNTPTTPPSILGAAGGNVDFGTQTVNLSYAPSFTNGDASHQVLSVLQSTLELDGGTVNVTNASGTTLDVGDYALIQCTNGINITSPLTLNYVGGSLAPNTAASLTVVSNMLVLQVLPAVSYANSQFTNQSPYPGQSIIYGTSTINLSATLIEGSSFPTQGETVTIVIPNVSTNATTISDGTGDFTATISANTVPAGTYPIFYSYAGNSGENLGLAYDTSTSLTVTKAVATVTANNQTKIYGQTLGSGAGQTAFTYSTLQNGETIGTVSLAFSGSPAGSANNAPTNTYTITPSAATGGTFNAANYTITYVAGTLLINPLPVGEGGTNTYSGATTFGFKNFTITNVVSGDNVTNVSGSTVTIASSAAGLEPITSFSVTLGGARATNYTTVGAVGAILINPLPVGLTGTNIYNGAATAPFSILSITNIVGSDVVSPASGSATLASPTVGPETITSASGLTLGGAQAGNYTTAGAIGSVTVNPLPVGLTGTRYYNGTATAVFSILTITNIVGSDIVNLVSGSVTLASPANGSEPITSASGLTLGGAQAGDYTTAGAIGAVAVTANSSPTSIVFSTANNAMTLSWPLDHTGWTLEAQTNSVSAGFSTNWSPVGGSTTTNQVVLPIDPNNGCVFYQLIYNP